MITPYEPHRTNENWDPAVEALIDFAKVLGIAFTGTTMDRAFLR